MIQSYKVIGLCFLGNTQMNKITDLKKKVRNLKNKYWLVLAANAVIAVGDCSHNLITEEKKQDNINNQDLKTEIGFDIALGDYLEKHDSVANLLTLLKNKLNNDKSLTKIVIIIINGIQIGPENKSNIGFNFQR